MLRDQLTRWFRRHGWIVYVVVAVAFLANVLVQFTALTRDEAGPATVPALVFSVIAFVCAAVVGVVLFRGRAGK